MAWRAVHLENLEIVDRAIDARSVVTIIVFFVVSEYPTELVQTWQQRREDAGRIRSIHSTHGNK
jgi:hypothetical protein